MRRTVAFSFSLVLASTWIAGCSRSTRASETTLGVREGAFEQVLELTGEVRAARGESLAVPATRAWQLSLRALAEDGENVERGDVLVEFDDGQIAGDLDKKQATAIEADASLRKARADAASALERAEFELDQAKNALDQARLRADIPAELLAARDYDDRQLALARAQAEAGKAEAGLTRAQAESREATGAAELELAKRRRDLSVAEEGLESLVLRAPHDGIALVQEHPWQGRKIQIGDVLYPGLPVVLLPDLDSLYVRALLFDVDDDEVRPGDAATCVADIHPELAFGCRVRDVAAVARELSPQSSRRAFQIALDLDDAASARELLRPGMSVRAEIVIERREHARIASRADLVVELDVVRLRTPDGGLEPIRLGPCNASECVVEAEGSP